MTIPPEPGRLERAAKVVQGLSLTNVLIIALLALIIVPAYVIWKATSDEKLLNRLMSTYEDMGSRGGCALRHVKERGGPDLYGLSAGFSFTGADRWYVNVILDHDPSDEEIVSYCESLKLIADTMLARGDTPLVDQPGGDAEIHGGPVPGAAPDRR